MKNIFATHFKVFLKIDLLTLESSFTPSMNPFHPHGGNKKIRTYNGRNLIPHVPVLDNGIKKGRMVPSHPPIKSDHGVCAAPNTFEM